MLLKEITVKKELVKKRTVKDLDGGFKSKETTGGITMTFTLGDGEQLRDEVEVAREANQKVLEALEDLMDTDVQPWLRTGTETKYKEAK